MTMLLEKTSELARKCPQRCALVLCVLTVILLCKTHKVPFRIPFFSAPFLSGWPFYSVWYLNIQGIEPRHA